MDKKDILRINELAKKKKQKGLTDEELAEQSDLRKRYLDEFRKSLIAQLDNTKIKEPDGSIHPLKKD